MADSPENKTDGPLGIVVKLAGQETPDTTQVLSIHVFNEANRIPEATFVVTSDGLQIEDFSEVDSDDYALGTEVEISAFYGDEAAETIFKGVIASTRLRLSGDRGAQLELTCRDKAIQMTEARASSPYVEMTDSDVMTQIIGDAGLTADVTATTAKAPLNLRVGATDWDFVRLMADRNGQVLTVWDGKVTSAVPDLSADPVLTVSYGIDIIEIDVTIDAHRMVASATAAAWSEPTQETVSVTSEAFPTDILGNSTYAKIAKTFGDRALTAATSREFTQSELTEMSKARMTRAGLAVIHGVVKFQGSGKINPTDMLEITGCGDRFSGNGFVTAVAHRIENGAWTTQVRLGLPQDWTSDIGALAAPAAEALTTPIHGLQIGKVLKIAEDEEGKQRIQVRLAMIADPPAEIWARHATPYASGNAGFQFLPEKDDEVVVAFLNADPNAPVIVGSLHNAKAKRPVEAVEDNFIKTIVTPTELKMTFDDEKMIITVETPGGHILTMDDDAAAFSLVDSNGNSIVMDDSGITMTTDFDITMTATGDITAEATGDATVNGMNVTCEGQTGFTGTGGASAEVSSGGQTKIEGSMVMIN